MNKKIRSRSTLAIQIILIYLASQLLPVFMLFIIPEADRIAAAMNSRYSSLSSELPLW